MPSTTPGAHGADPFEQARLAARELARHAGTDHHDVVVVLGAALWSVAPLLGARDPAIDMTNLPWSPRFSGNGRRPEAWSLEIGAARVLVVAGRLHLYEGRTPAEVVHVVRTAVAAGCRTVVLTGRAGAVDPGLAVGRVVAVADHLDLTATSPLTGIPGGPSHPALTDAWSPALRRLAHEVEPSLPEGVYAQLHGPQLETQAEVRMLTTLGADLVGMSIVPEAVAARHLGAEVLGLVVVTNPAGAAPGPVDEDGLPDEAAGAAGEVAHLVQGVVELLGEDGGRDAGGPEAATPEAPADSVGQADAGQAAGAGA